MWLAIISSILCFIFATVLFAKSTRNGVVYWILSFYFIFQGTWSLFDFMFRKLSSESMLTSKVNYIATIIFTAILLFYISKDKEDIEQTLKKDDSVNYESEFSNEQFKNID